MPRYACNLAPGCISSDVKLCQRKPLFPFFRGPLFLGPLVSGTWTSGHATPLEGTLVRSLAPRSCDAQVEHVPSGVQGITYEYEYIYIYIYIGI